MTNFFVGQKVVCIHKGRWNSAGEQPPSTPSKGEVCTVTWKGSTRRLRHGIKLAEHSHGVFNARLFRPIKDTRIENLRKLLNLTPDDIRRLNDHDTKRFIERQKERAPS